MTTRHLALVYPKSAAVQQSAKELVDDVVDLLTVVHAHLSLVLEASRTHPVNRHSELVFAREAVELGAELTQRLEVLLRPVRPIPAVPALVAAGN